jgi:hypothetical protein
VALPFHDHLEATPIDGLTCLVEVRRVYLLDWQRFREEDHQTLRRIFEALPGALPDRDRPVWFGDEEDLPPFLQATVVPGGLQVSGILPEADWWAWDSRFRHDADGLPCGTRRSPPAIQP